MFALSDYYTNLFKSLVEADRGNGDGSNFWFNLAGTELPWEETEEPCPGPASQDQTTADKIRCASASRMEALRALERSSLESMPNTNLNSMKGLSTSKNSSSLAHHWEIPEAYEESGGSQDDGSGGDGSTDGTTEGSLESEEGWLLNFQPSKGSGSPKRSTSVGSSSSAAGFDRNKSSNSVRTVSPPPMGKIKSVMRKSLVGSPGSHAGYTGAMSLWEGLAGSVMNEKRESKRVKFCSTAQCVLIPSRSDLSSQGIDRLLWFDESVLEQSKREAQEELKNTLASNSSSLSLYAAMNLLYRPCIKGSNNRRDHFRMLVVDDSVVARRMFIHTVVLGHKSSGTKEHLYVHQANSFKSALESIQLHSYNLIVIDEYLTSSGQGSSEGEDNGQYGSDLIRLARQQLENCVFISISGCLDSNAESTDLGRETRKRMKSCGADIVLRKPVPVDTWEQLITCLPVEF